MSGAELSPMETKKSEYTNLQPLVQVHTGPPAGPPDGPDVGAHPAAGSTATSSPRTTGQAADLPSWTDERCPAPPGEKTPGSYGDVPGSVMARVTAGESPDDPSANSSASSLRPLGSAAKVCLEKRFNDTDGPRRQDLQAAILNNFLTKLNESSEAPEVLLPQVHKWMKSVEVFSPRAEAELNPVTTTCGTGSDVVIPAASKRRRRRRISAKGKDLDGSDSRKSLQREQHNSLERERRKRISLFCDELNALVPFCDSKTDRVTTLQWTTAFLRFIDKMFGDALKKEFQRTFIDKTGTSPESSLSSGLETGQREKDETLSIDLKLEQ